MHIPNKSNIKEFPQNLAILLLVIAYCHIILLNTICLPIYHRLFGCFSS